MRVGIIRYPGSNCDDDTLRYFKNSFYIWHTETKLPNIDLLVIPGGFAFGDRCYKKATESYEINPGQMAIDSPVSKLIYEAFKKKIKILGICNGFQILIKLKLLPGELCKNSDGKFHSKKVNCSLIKNNSEEEINLYIANKFGNYQIDNDKFLEMKHNKQIFLKYKNHNNGSFENIAGVCDSSKTVYGLMPHPERNENNFKNYIFHIMGLNNFEERINRLIKSEHISYKSTRKYLSKLYTKNKNVIQGPGENAGIIKLDEEYCLALRIESHNHPIFIDPYNGASTGVGGILRDIFTMGARPIALLDFLRFGTDKHNEKLIDKTIEGISDYCNCIGIPNVGGDFYKSEIYNKNPLLNVACLGLVKKENIIYGNALNQNSLLIYIGGKTGKEGVDGAFMASKQFNSESNLDNLKENIQTGDPFLEKLLLEACCEISELNIIEGMQDMGAGGILCSSVEVVLRGRKKTNKKLGCEIYIDKIPVKYEMDLCDILISESQERMLLVCDKNNIDKVFTIFEKWDLEYSIIGKVTNDSCYSVLNNNYEIYSEYIENFDCPHLEWDLKPFVQNKNINYESKKIKNTDYWTTYDHSIGNRTIKGPLDPKHYSILNIREINRNIIITWGEKFKICYDKILELGGTPLCLINCLNYGHPNDSLLEFKNFTEELTQDCKKYDVPVVGGNVSLYNSTNDISIKPTPILVMIGIL